MVLSESVDEGGGEGGLNDTADDDGAHERSASRGDLSQDENERRAQVVLSWFTVLPSLPSSHPFLQ